MGSACGDAIADMGFKGELLVLASACDMEIDGDKGRILNRDAHFFNGCNQKEFIILALENGLEKFYHPGPPDGRALVKPSAILRYAHVNIAAKGWVPQMHRRRPFVCTLLSLLRQCQNIFEWRFHNHV